MRIRYENGRLCYMSFQDAGAGENPGSVPNAGERPNQNDGQQNQNTNGQDNSQDNVDPIATIWDNPIDDNNDAAPTNEPAPIQSRDASEVVAEHIKSLQLAPTIPQDFAENFQNGDFSGLSEVIGQTAEKVYARVLGDASALIKNEAAKAVDAAVQKSGGIQNAQTAIISMQDRLPFTKDPAVAPMAKLALGKAIQKGASVDDAIEQVQSLFQHTANAVTGRDPNKPPRGNRGGTRPANTNQQINDAGIPDDIEDEDWFGFLTAG